MIIKLTCHQSECWRYSGYAERWYHHDAPQSCIFTRSSDTRFGEPWKTFRLCRALAICSFSLSLLIFVLSPENYVRKHSRLTPRYTKKCASPSPLSQLCCSRLSRHCLTTASPVRIQHRVVRAQSVFHRDVRQIHRYSIVPISQCLDISIFGFVSTSS